MKIKSKLSKYLRKLKLLRFADQLRFYYTWLKMYKKNRKFRSIHPHTKLPKDYLMYESFLLDYDSYYNGGKVTAEWIVGLIRNHKEIKHKKILDWGCGPGRVIRHMPTLLEETNQFFATDYNEESIDWCSKNIDHIDFKTNHLSPPLQYENDFFDIIYGISIFTHLSEKMHTEWINELRRVLKKDGILIVSMQGNNFKLKLTPSELKEFSNGKLVVRGNTKEGHRMYSAFHPETFVKYLFKDFTILDHIVYSDDLANSNISQDVWVIKK
ncbi:ubiquinone/menaquinone biosynthesis C-methylase UbiE [Chryseobacterium bernardetii]|uniref:Methyltransferase family protein n=3 Tax=Chryseobacterium TaxID=59732 RepID=A0A543ECF7_9FLAO|nr:MULTISPECIES: class I SAM-dependent methyltransferase [Chryseobacterium]MDR6442750.1 ubiquinone/menaquinone biosynthesis C-methylase UbiE [Chryseobacterium bernardetii]TQM19274.1 methyltransferase family protein [Chryseobacterium aquifrigidense]